MSYWKSSGMPDVVRDSSFPQYAYGVLQAAFQAKNLGIERITVLELGVAGGNGLVEMERLCSDIGRDQGVRIDPVGFDLGDGMPKPVDHRDCPYVWQEGFFAMDEPLLRSRLKAADLRLGDISATGPEFMREAPAPIGFISFDFDYYSSTVSAFNALLGHSPERFLPRVLCYFDDTAGPHEELHSEFTGELLAIKEFNEAHEKRKIAKVNALRYKFLPLSETSYELAWIEGIHVLHLFDHPRCNDYIFPERSRQFPLESGEIPSCPS